MPNRSPANIIWSAALVLASVVMCIAAWRLHVEAKEFPAAAMNRGGIPAGTIVAFAGTSAPDGWLICDGSPISDPRFSTLREALKAAVWPTGSDRVPDLRGMFLRGAHGDEQHLPAYRDNGGRTGDTYYVGTLQLDTTRPPRNGFFWDGATKVQATGLWAAAPSRAINGQASINHSGETNGAVSTGDNETCPKNAAVNWIIKY